jgi:hypothetical protein
MAAGAPATLNKLGVPRPVSHALSAPRATPALAAAKEWWLSGRPVLLLLGGVGSGKTTGAAWVLLRQLEREAGVTHPSGGHPVDPAMFATAPEFNGLSDYHPESRAWLERLCRCTLLVLDDLGTERMGDGELSCVQRVISERHATNRRTSSPRTSPRRRSWRGTGSAWPTGSASRAPSGRARSRASSR